MLNAKNLRNFPKNDMEAYHTMDVFEDVDRSALGKKQPLTRTVSVGGYKLPNLL